MNYPVTIVTVIVDRHNLTMYMADGNAITIPQGDPRVRDLVAKAVPVIDAGGTYLLTSEDMYGKNHYAETEKKTNGLIRFFKMAKAKFQEIAEKFCEPVEPVVAGKIPGMEHTVGDIPVVVEPEPVKPKLPPIEERPLTRGASAVAEIMAHAKPSSDKDFASVVSAQEAQDTGAEEQIVVAVTSDNTVVHGVEQLADQMKAVSAGVTSGEGMTRFLERAASVTRGHSVEDLLKFVQKGELPFADDGTVLVYKRLKPTKEDGVFVDVYSGNVKQCIGSFVHMDMKLVDPNRHQACSNGLHVARRDYLHAFSGDVVVLCKLAPEDVIAVPSYDARKLRAKGYHIIAQLSKEDAELVCRNKPMLDTELLANAIAGNHLPILEYVEITASMGGGLKVTKVESPEQREASLVRAVSSLDNVPDVNPEASEVDARALALDLAKPTKQLYQAPPGGGYICQVDESCGQATPVPAPRTPADAGINVSTKAEAGLGLVSAVVPGSTKRPVQLLVEAFQNGRSYATAKALLDYKKSCKKSWTALGVPASMVDELKGFEAASKLGPVTLMAVLVPEVPTPKAKKAVAPKPPVVKTKDKPVVQATKAKVKPMATPTGTPKRSQKEEAAHLLDIYTKNPDYINCKQLVAFKKSTKKGWSALGIDEAVGKKAEARVKV